MPVRYYVQPSRLPGFYTVTKVTPTRAVAHTHIVDDLGNLVPLDHAAAKPSLKA